MKNPLLLWLLGGNILLWSSLVAQQTHAAKPEATRPSSRVLIIGVDGTRPDALLKAATPNLDELIRTGAFTPQAQILGERYQQNDTISGPGWSSILTGVWADKHGVHNNEFTGKQFELFPHFFKRIKRVYHDARTVSLVSWGPIHEHILSEADVAEVLPLAANENSVVDLKVSADKLGINTRDGQWHHLLATRRGQTLSLYLDGILIGERNEIRASYDLGGDSYYLGRDTRLGPTCFAGQLDDLRLWNRGLSAEEIKVWATSPDKNPQNEDRSGLLLEYNFESEISLAEGREHLVAADPRTGKSLELTSSGESDHGLRVPISEAVRRIPQHDFTVEARFRTTDAGRNILMGNYDGREGAINLELHENNSVRIYLQPARRDPLAHLIAEDRRDAAMANRAVEVLREDDPDAMFIYFHQTDATGHTIGFSPEVPQYLQAIENVDCYVGQVLTALRSRPNYLAEDWLVIVCTDHGGLRQTHGGGHQIPEIRTVFLIVAGPAIEAGSLTQPATLVDVTGTALTHVLGQLDPRWQLDGQAVELLKQKP